MAISTVDQFTASPVMTSTNMPNKTDDESVWGKDGFSFADLLDIINPLQHIPIVSTFYQKLTGDEIGDAPRIIGGTLFGGAVGLAGASLDTLVKHESGQTIEDHVLALLQETDPPQTSPESNPDSVAEVAGVTKDSGSPDSEPDVMDDFFADMRGRYQFHRKPSVISDDNLLAGVLRRLGNSDNNPLTAEQRAVPVQQAVSQYQQTQDALSASEPILPATTG